MRPTLADEVYPVKEEQIEALLSLVFSLADECAIAIMEDRIDCFDAEHLAQMVAQVKLFLQPGDGLELPGALWPTDKKGRFSKIPPAHVLVALRRSGFTDERIASLIGCSRTLVIQRRKGERVPRPTKRR